MEMSQKLVMDKRIPIRIDFEHVDAEKFGVVKKYLGLKQNTEVIRALISLKYNQIMLMEEKRRSQQLRETKALKWLEKGEYKCPM